VRKIDSCLLKHRPIGEHSAAATATGCAIPRLFAKWIAINAGKAMTDVILQVE